MEDQDYIVFDQYLQKELSKEEQSNFEERLKNDENFKNSFNTYKELSLHLEHKFEGEAEAMAFKENLQNISTQHFNKNTTEGKSSKFSIFKYAVAATVALLIGITAFNQLSSPSYADYNNHEIISLSIRGGGDSLLKEAENAFNSKNYSEAESVFNKILEKTPSNLEIQLYKAISLIETNQFSEADELLLGLSETNSAYKTKAQWYWALSKLKQEDKDACIKILQQIPEGTEYYKHAQKLLNKLD